MQMLTMIKNQLKLLFNNRAAVFAIIAAPLLLTYLFSLSSGDSKTNIYISDSDKSIYSKQLIDMINHHNDINVINVTEPDIKKKLDNGSITNAFLINKDFGRNLIENNSLEISMLQNYESGDGTLLQQTVLNEANSLKKIVKDANVISNSLYLSKDEIANDLLKKINSPSNIFIIDENISNKNMQNSTFIKLIGFLVMFIWFVVIQGFRTLIHEKENNTFNRILGTPTNYNMYLISKTAATYIFGLIITAVILISGKYIFNINFTANITIYAIIFAFYIFSLTGITMVFVPFIKKQQSFTILGAVIMVLTGILGGSFFSIDEIGSGIMQLMSKFTPESWAIKAITDVTLNSKTLNSVIPSLLILAIVGVIGFLISYSLLRIKQIVRRA